VWIKYDPNPVRKGDVGDCVIRALTKALGKTWDAVYWDLCILGAYYGNWGNGNEVWRRYLRDNGFRRYIVPNTCPDCYTVRDFCADHPRGVYVLSTGANGGTHVVCVVDGNYYDSWDSGNDIPIYYYFRRA